MFTFIVGTFVGIVIAGAIAWALAWLVDGDNVPPYAGEEYRHEYGEMPSPRPQAPVQVANTHRSMNDVLTTMVSSWGSDTPQEIFWTLAELTTLVNQKAGLSLEIPDQEIYDIGEDSDGNSIFNNRLKALGDAMDDLL